jgi:hypothetical protein
MKVMLRLRLKKIRGYIKSMEANRKRIALASSKLAELKRTVWLVTCPSHSSGMLAMPRFYARTGLAFLASWRLGERL